MPSSAHLHGPNPSSLPTLSSHPGLHAGLSPSSAAAAALSAAGISPSNSATASLLALSTGSLNAAAAAAVAAGQSSGALASNLTTNGSSIVPSGTPNSTTSSSSIALPPNLSSTPKDTSYRDSLKLGGKSRQVHTEHVKKINNFIIAFLLLTDDNRREVSFF